MALAFAPDGKTLAVADILGSITLWDLDRSTPMRSIHGDGDELRQLAFTPDGAAVAAAGKNGVIRLWDPATGQELLSLAAHRARSTAWPSLPTARPLARSPTMGRSASGARNHEGTALNLGWLIKSLFG